MPSVQLATPRSNASPRPQKVANSFASSSDLGSALDEESTTLNGVDQDVAALEVGVVAPGADEVDGSSVRLGVVLGVDVEEADLGDLAAGGVLGQRRDVNDAEAGAVVALVGEAVNDELVVVDTVGGALVDTSLLRGLEGADVPEVGDGVSRGSGASGVVLIVLVVEDEVLLPLGVGNPTLVSVCFKFY